MSAPAALVNLSGAAREALEIVASLLPEENGPYELHEPELTDAEREQVLQALDEGFISYAGRQVGLFEQALARTAGVAEAVAVVSGTAAIHAILHALAIGREDEVLCPSLTFVATANAIVHAGATPHFVDSDPDHLGIDVERLEAHLRAIARRNGDRVINRITGRRIAAILPVHVFGHMGDMPGLQAIADEWDLPLIEDATESIGSRDAQGHAGHAGIAAALSFNGNKLISTGGGGAVLTNDTAFAEQLRHLTTTAKRPHPWRFEHDAVGHNYRLPNINAALGLAQIARLPDMLERKRRLATAYIERFSAAESWRPFVEVAGRVSNYWLNIVLLSSGADMALLEESLGLLHTRGYRCRPCWVPMHQLAIHSGHPRDGLPVAEDLAARILCLPSSPFLADRLQCAAP